MRDSKSETQRAKLKRETTLRTTTAMYRRRLANATKTITSSINILRDINRQEKYNSGVNY